MAHSNTPSCPDRTSTQRQRTPGPIALAAGLTIILLSMSMAGGVSARAAGPVAEDQPGRPVALAAADFDEDGIPDLVSGFATSSGGVVTIRRGNADTIYPHTPAARARRQAGRSIASPFLPGGRAFTMPAVPAFLHTGDFDADGHFDVIGAASGGAALVLRGDGTGGFFAAEAIALPGVVTAMAVGDINGLDGLADVVFAVTDRTGSRLVVFAGHKGAWRSSPAVFDLPAPAAAVAVGRLDDEHMADIAVAAGTDLLLVHGGSRRPRPEPGANASPAVERRALPFAVKAMIAGDFTGDRRPDLAVASAEGAVHVLASAESERALASEPQDLRASRPRDLGAQREAGAPAVGTLDRWTVRPMAEGVATDGATLVRARISNRGADDLLVVNRAATPARVADDRGAVRHVAPIAAAAVLPMRLDIDGRDDLVLLRDGEAEPTIETTLDATSRVVVNTNDSGPGSLRQAILDANAEDGDDLITFDIPGPSPHVITPATPLPVVGPLTATREESIIIDGTSEPDFAGTPIIEISGALVGSTGDGLWIATSRCVVRGLVINRFRYGLVFGYLDGASVESGWAEGNYIGTDVSGTTAQGNQVGVVLTGFARVGPAGITVGGTVPAARNVISGNGTGLDMGFAGSTLIHGNFIGTDASGALPLGNVGRGILASEGGHNEIGGADPGAGNVISANGNVGVFITDSGPELISHNLIGTDASGTIALGNSGNGIEVAASQVTIADNVVAASTGFGIDGIAGIPHIEFLRNRIGTNSAGTAALGNQGGGIVTSGSEQTMIGNLVSGNGSHGIGLIGTARRVEENLIGTDITGTRPLGNEGDGVQMLDVSHVIGGDGVGNVIAFNRGRGIMSLPMFTSFPILSNAIFANGGLGIDLGGDGVSPNDECDEDEGTVNFPVLTGVTSTVSATTIAGRLNSLPSESFELQFFSSAEADPSGFGEGARLLGSTMVTTDAACNASFSVTFPVPVPADHFVTATSTTMDDVLRRRATSEFSNAVRFVPETSEEAIRALIDDVAGLVADGELNAPAGRALTARLKAALSFVERDDLDAAARQLRGFIFLTEALVRSGKLDSTHGQALVDAARAILADLETS